MSLNDITQKDLLAILMKPQGELTQEEKTLTEQLGDDFLLQIINETFDTEDAFQEMMYRRKFEQFPGEGVLIIRNLFNEFPKELEKAQNDISLKRKKKKLISLKRCIEWLNDFEGNFLIKFEIKNHKPYFPDYIKAINKAMESLPPQPKADDSLPETLSDLITHPNSVEIVGAIKIQYRNVKGKRLKLLLLALQELDLLPKERIAKKYHTYCKQEFDWNIASYNAMNGYDFNERTDVDEFQNMTSFLKELKNAK